MLFEVYETEICTSESLRIRKKGFKCIIEE